MNIYSISTARQTGGDNGYTLDGIQMVYSRAKLLNTDMFGSSGIYPKSVSIYDGYSTEGSLKQVTALPNDAIFFFGFFNKNDASLYPFTNEEIDSLYNWSKRGGKLIIGADPNLLPMDCSILNNKWGFNLVPASTSFLYPTSEGMASSIFNGPFGLVYVANQGGTLQGYFVTIPDNSVVLARDSYHNPTLYLDCNTLDLVAADVDVFTTLGGITYYNYVNGEQDRFFANVFAYMDKLQNQPFIFNTGINLLCTDAYSNYQWYYNGNIIPGATQQNYDATRNGNYYVEVTLDCGCKSFSNTITINTFSNECGDIFIPSAFSPNGDGNNDTLYVRGKCIKSMLFSIFNRWGKKIFETHNPQSGWDGKQNGKKCNTDVFVYYLKVERYDGTVVEKKGDINLIR